MQSIRSVTAGGPDRGDELAERILPEFAANFPAKYLWFLQQGYSPHAYQAAFHVAHMDGRLTRFRHLVAGRRGGKTLSAAWEVLFYATHPEEFCRDTKGTEWTGRPLWIWALAKDNTTGRPSLMTFLEVLRQAGFVKDRHYRYNKTEKVFEFLDGQGEMLSIVEFKSADDPNRLRGAGLDMLWIDESAFIPNRDAWDVLFPALADREGLVITTTTPHGKNWFWEMFFSGRALEDTNQFRVEYTSIDNPYFPRLQWEYALEHYHPVMFKQEFMAAFDALSGIALQGDWLKYYVIGQPDPNSDAITIPREKDGRFSLTTYMGIDPAISLSEDADHFAMVLLGITKAGDQAFLLKYYVDRIPFPDQLDKIREWVLQYRPAQIGIEAQAYQASLAQMAARMEGLPNIVPVFSKAKKTERILGMAPLFKVGKVRIHHTHAEFIDQWINYDPAIKNPDDDLLDATEIALGTAGVLLPVMPVQSIFDDAEPTLESEARWMLNHLKDKRSWDPELGIEG